MDLNGKKIERSEHTKSTTLQVFILTYNFLQVNSAQRAASIELQTLRNAVDVEAVFALEAPPPLTTRTAHADAAATLRVRAGPTAEIATEQPQRVPDSF